MTEGLKPPEELNMEHKSEIIIYQTEDGKVKVETFLKSKRRLKYEYPY